jgi:uncharacterized protein (TIGR00255 family)
MTGYGDASEQVDNTHYSVELRSVNNRYFKTTMRLPEVLAGLEAELETLLRKRLCRGTVFLTVKMPDEGQGSAPRVDDDVLLGYLSHLESLRSKVTSPNQTINIDLTSLLALPGVLRPTIDEQAVVDRARPVVTRLTTQACEKLLAMRKTEGGLLCDDLERQRGVIGELLSQIADRAPEVIEVYHQRLRTRIDDLLARAQLRIEQQDLVREVAIFAERADISEEVSRMGAHMQQFEQIIRTANGEPAGRTLDFLAQELLREANTIASKSNDAQISRAIVEVKGAIDRIKEQVQNVE